MRLIVVKIKLLSLVLQQPILIGWDKNVAFNMLLCEKFFYIISLAIRRETMSLVTCL